MSHSLPWQKHAQKDKHQEFDQKVFRRHVDRFEKLTATNDDLKNQTNLLAGVEERVSLAFTKKVRLCK